MITYFFSNYMYMAIINKFKYYIDTLKRNDIEVYSIHDNVLIDIGATKINIEDII